MHSTSHQVTDLLSYLRLDGEIDRTGIVVVFTGNISGQHQVAPIPPSDAKNIKSPGRHSREAIGRALSTAPHSLARAFARHLRYCYYCAKAPGWSYNQRNAITAAEITVAGHKKHIVYRLKKRVPDPACFPAEQQPSATRVVKRGRIKHRHNRFSFPDIWISALRRFPTQGCRRQQQVFRESTAVPGNQPII